MLSNRVDLLLKRPTDTELKAISQLNGSTFGTKETSYLQTNLDRLIQALILETDEVLVKRYQGAVELLQDLLNYRSASKDIIHKRKGDK